MSAMRNSLMTQRKFRQADRLLWLVLMAWASGCAGPGTTELLSPPPQNYHEVVAARLGTAYYEAIIPTQAEISTPFVGQSQLGASSQVCVRAPRETPRTEPSIIAVTFRAGDIVDVDYEYGYATCSSATYKPFPELKGQYKRPAPGAKRPQTVGPNPQSRMAMPY